MRIIHVGSISGGKDSQAVIHLMLERCRKENCRFVFADTGNEDPAVFEHLNYLREHLGIEIDVLKASFDEQIAAKRMFIARDQRTKRSYKKVHKVDAEGKPVWVCDKNGNPRLVPIEDDAGEVKMVRVQKMGFDRGTKWRWSNKAKRRALAALHPTGNPYLDLCMWKGRFPSRKAQFCTSELKTIPLVEYQMALIDQGYGVISWQGVRRDESFNRRLAKKFNRVGPRLWHFRPIVDWTAQQTVDFSLSRGTKLNPLYSQGFNRVGCMPCINCAKADIANIALRRPAEIERLDRWEKLVAAVSKRGAASFFPNPNRDAHQDKRGIFKMVAWSKTEFGGRTQSLIPPDEPNACSSSYGLCESAGEASMELAA